MSSTITAMFDSRADAEAAKERLKVADIDASHIQVHDQSSVGYQEGRHSTHQDRGFWDSVKNAFLPDEDRHTYEEGVRRGGAVLTADVDDDAVDRAVKALEDAGSVDIDDRASQWRQSGWSYPAAGAGLVGSAGGDGADRYAGEREAGTTGAGAFGGAYGATASDTTGRNGGAQEEVIPIVEEQLIVGKRDVSRGGVHVRSYVSETPVHEQVRLRDERVNVERRPVDREISSADDAFRERTIDVTATGEEAVVGKTARVVEEVVVSKTADERVETIDDTVRRTEVEVDDQTGRSTGYRDDERR